MKIRSKLFFKHKVELMVSLMLDLCVFSFCQNSFFSKLFVEKRKYSKQSTKLARIVWKFVQALYLYFENISGYFDFFSTESTNKIKKQQRTFSYVFANF